MEGDPSGSWGAAHLGNDGRGAAVNSGQDRLGHRLHCGGYRGVDLLGNDPLISPARLERVLLSVPTGLVMQALQRSAFDLIPNPPT